MSCRLGDALFYISLNKNPSYPFLGHLFYRKIHIFLQKLLGCCLLFYVCQMFDNPWVLAVERANTFRGFSSFLLRGCIYIMSSACLTVRGAAFAPSFKHALVISFINHPRLEKQKRLCVLLSRGQHPTDGRSSCQTQKHPAEELFRIMEFFYKEPFLQERIGGILFM